MTVPHPHPMADLPIEPILRQLEQALAERDTARAFELLGPWSARLEDDARLAGAWLTLLRIAPGHAQLAEDVGRILTRYPLDRDLQLSGCDALIRAAEL